MAKQPGSVSSPYLTLREVARYFRVDESTIRKGCGVFKLLQLTTTELEPGKRRGRTLVLCESVERVDDLLRKRAEGVSGSLKLVKGG
jgi:hypothetical protein